MRSKTIGVNDVPDGEDKLSVDGYFTALTTYIEECLTPTTISIQGDWGSGKTTAIRNIEEKLKQSEKNIKSVCLNVWPYSNLEHGGNVVGEMLQDLTALLVEEKVLKESETNQLKEIALTCGRIAARLLVAGTTNALFANFLGGTAAAEANVEGTAQGDTTNDDLRESICKMREFKAALKEAIHESELDRLVIFVDDLDRLNPRLALEILEALKNFIDCEWCVFVLAIDSEIVNQGVKEKYGSSFSDDKARKFFDKIIQLQFYLPVASYNIESYLNEMFLENGDDVKEYEYAVKELIGPNPRNIKRAFNLLELYEQIVRVQDKETWKHWRENKYYIFVLLITQLYNNGLYMKLVENAKRGRSINEFKLDDDSDVEVDGGSINGQSENERHKEERHKKDIDDINALRDVLDLSDDDNAKKVDDNLRSLSKIAGVEDPNSMKIGKYVRYNVEQMIKDDLIDEGMIENLLDKEWTSKTFKVPYQFLREEPHPRYYATPYIIHGKKYYLCAQWKEPSRPFFDEWLREYK